MCGRLRAKLTIKCLHPANKLPFATVVRSHFSSSSPPAADRDPRLLLKEDPVEICSALWIKSFSSPPKTTFANLTGFLSKLELWVLGYQRACAHFTGSYPQRTTLSSDTVHAVNALRRAVVRDRFRWNDKIRQIIRNPNDTAGTKIMSRKKLRAMMRSEEPCFQDRIVQEVLLLVLEPFFEPRFSKKSHGFRPGRNPHTVIRTLRNHFSGYLWFLKGDLSKVFDGINLDILIACLKKVIRDKNVINLIRNGFQKKDGCEINQAAIDDKDQGKRRKNKKKATEKKILHENEPKPDPYWLRVFDDFAPKEAVRVPNYGFCGILSPLLANVFLNELDSAMEVKIDEFYKPNKEDSIWKDSSDDGCHNPSWPEFVPASGSEKTRKMDYIRHGCHFLIGIRGPREEAVKTRNEIITFCEEKLGVTLTNMDIEIGHVSRGVLFLDHMICHRMIRPTLRYTGNRGKIVNSKGMGTYLSITGCLQQCIHHFKRLDLLRGDKNPEPLPCMPMLYSGQAHTNAQMNKFLESMADWYKYADNRKKIVGFCAYIIRGALAKLYAARYRLRSRAKVFKIASRNLSFPLRESSKVSVPEYSDLLRMGLVDRIEGVQFSHMGSIPPCDYTKFPKNWVPYHEQILHEYAKLQDPQYFFQLRRVVKNHESSLPREEISAIAWDYKTLGISRPRHFGHKRRACAQRRHTNIIACADQLKPVDTLRGQRKESDEPMG